MHLSPEEISHVTSLLERGEKLPAKYRALLDDAPDIELVWSGKQPSVTRAILPFQSIEQIDEPRSEQAQQMGLFEMDSGTGRQSGGWTNKLIWGDNRLVLSSLLNGHLREDIEAAGGLKMVYIDPPFDVGADFTFEMEVGGESIVKEPSVIEDIAYRDTWGKNGERYPQFFYERLTLIRDLMADDGSIWVQVDWRLNGIVRLILDEVFGRENFRNQVTWRRQVVRGRKGEAYFMPFCADYILVYTKSPRAYWKPIEVETALTMDEARRKLKQDEGGFFSTSDPGTYSNESLLRLYEEGRVFITNGGEAVIKNGVFSVTRGTPRIKYYRETRGDQVVELGIKDNIWDDIPGMGTVSGEYLDYPTQKPKGLLRRIIQCCTKDGDLVADFFCGSGTTLEVAERMGRRWIGCDIGRFAVHVSRKRLIGVQRQLKASAEPYRSFEVLNLGRYERQFLMGIHPNWSDERKAAAAEANEDKYLDLVLEAYRAERVRQTPPFHGRRGTTLVRVGALDAPVTLSEAREVVEACKRLQTPRADILGFEFEMGIVPLVQDEARASGVTLGLRYIPKDVFDSQVVDEVRFTDVAYVEVKSKTDGLKALVTLEDFGVPYSQDDSDDTAEALKNGGAKVIIDAGQVVCVSKDKKGVVTREVLTKKWSDWIDYWSVDFDFENRPEILKVVEGEEEKEVWSGNYIFENEWQAFRARTTRELELTSAWHDYPEKGTYKVAVKVIDIFGNDTTKVIEVRV